MATNTSITDKPTDSFKLFPEFSKLELGDRLKYEHLLKDYPPIDAIQFYTLISWWNTLDSCRISRLNDNLIISYWLPGMEAMSGLSVIGSNCIDETICAVFDEQKQKGEEPKVVQIPEFVIDNIKHPELFNFTPMVDLDEYVIPVAGLYPLSNEPVFKRQRIRKFISVVGEQSIICKSLDLRNDDEKLQLLKAIGCWSRKGKGNAFSTYSDDAMKFSVDNHEVLGFKNVCLFVNGELESCMLYYPSNDKRYALVSHFRVNSEIPYTFEYACYAFCDWMSSQGYYFLNLTYDAGIPSLRTLKLSLKPSHFFRKYTISPSC